MFYTVHVASLLTGKSCIQQIHLYISASSNNMFTTPVSFIPCPRPSNRGFIFFHDLHLKYRARTEIGIVVILVLKELKS